METNPTTVLMERVLREAGGTYLSDVHDPAKARGIARAVRAIPLAAYPDPAWAALANYIIRQKRTFAGAGQAATVLIAYLEERE